MEHVILFPCQHRPINATKETRANETQTTTIQKQLHTLFSCPTIQLELPRHSRVNSLKSTT